MSSHIYSAECLSGVMCALKLPQRCRVNQLLNVSIQLICVIDKQIVRFTGMSRPLAATSVAIMMAESLFLKRSKALRR